MTAADSDEEETPEHEESVTRNQGGRHAPRQRQADAALEEPAVKVAPVGVARPNTAPTSGGGSPTPAEGLTMLAVGSSTRREVDAITATAAAPNYPVSSVPADTSPLEFGLTPALTPMDAAAVNSGPMASPSVGLPDVVKGTVTGSLNATDPESGSLTYAVQYKSADAAVTVDGTGNFVYTPSHSQRLEAASTSGVDTDTFTVRVADAQAFTDDALSVVVRPGHLAGGAG